MTISIPGTSITSIEIPQLEKPKKVDLKIAIYDAIAFSRYEEPNSNQDSLDEPEVEIKSEEEGIEEQQKALEFLRPFEEAERARCANRFDNPKIGIFIVLGTMGRGWDSSLYSKPLRKLVDKSVFIRAYRRAPEMLPKHFRWEEIKKEACGYVGWYGGTLLDEKHRL